MLLPSLKHEPVRGGNEICSVLFSSPLPLFSPLSFSSSSLSLSSPSLPLLLPLCSPPSPSSSSFPKKPTISLPRESEIVLEVYDLSRPKEPQVDLLRANALEKLDNASHEAAVFRAGQGTIVGSPTLTNRKVATKKKVAPPPPALSASPTSSGGEEEGNNDPLATEYSYASFPLYWVKDKWLAQVDQYLNDSSSAGLHGTLGGLRSLYGMEGEKWSYAREKVEVGLIKGTGDCGNSSVQKKTTHKFHLETKKTN